MPQRVRETLCIASLRSKVTSIDCNGATASATTRGRHAADAAIQLHRPPLLQCSYNGACMHMAVERALNSAVPQRKRRRRVPGSSHDQRKRRDNGQRQHGQHGRCCAGREAVRRVRHHLEREAAHARRSQHKNKWRHVSTGCGEGATKRGSRRQGGGTARACSNALFEERGAERVMVGAARRVLVVQERAGVREQELVRGVLRHARQH